MNYSSRPLTKRPRAAIACNGCRQSKVKCDSERPKCGRCTKDDIECVYTQDGRKKRVNRYRVESDLRLKVQDLEARLASASCANDGGVHGTSPVNNTSPSIAHGERIDNETSPVQSSCGASTGDSLFARSYTESLPDVRATEVFDPLPPSDIGYFGPSSNHALFRSLTAEIMNLGFNSARRHLEPLWPGQIGSKDQCQKIRRTRSLEEGSNDLMVTETGFPERRTALQLISRFFDSVGAVLPYTNESALIMEVHKLDGSTSDGRLPAPDVRALLNIVFAHALSPLDEAASEAFYSRAFHLLEIESQHMSSLESLQACLLLVSFQQNSRRAISSWTTHCLAVKISYQLGVHAPLTHEGLNADEKQFRAKLWLGVVTQDRILSSALGRPSLIPLNHVQKHITKLLNPVQHTGQAGAILLKEAYFRNLISLHEITGAAVDEIYNFNIGTSEHMDLDDLVAKTLDLARKMDRWRNNCLPSKIPQRDFKSRITFMGVFGAEKFEALLSIHYYRTVLLVNGPLLIGALERRTLSDSHGSDIFQDVAVPLLSRDFNAAKELSEILSCISSCNPTFFGSNAIWWICNYGVLTLCLHLMGFWMISLSAGKFSSDLGISPSKIEGLLRDTLETLRSIGGSSIMSSKAHHCMRQYLDFLSSIAVQTTVDELGNLDQLLSVRENSSRPVINDTNLDDFLNSMETEDALFSSLLGSEGWTGELHDISLI